MTSIYTYDHSLGPLSTKNQYGGLKNKILRIYPINVHLMTVLWFHKDVIYRPNFTLNPKMTSIFTYDHSLGPLSAKNQYGGLKNKILLDCSIYVHQMTIIWP